MGDGNYRTPGPVYAEYHREFNFNVDAAADVENTLVPSRYYTVETDGANPLHYERIKWYRSGTRCLCNCHRLSAHIAAKISQQLSNTSIGVPKSALASHPGARTATVSEPGSDKRPGAPIQSNDNDSLPKSTVTLAQPEGASESACNQPSRITNAGSGILTPPSSGQSLPGSDANKTGITAAPTAERESDSRRIILSPSATPTARERSLGTCCPLATPATSGSEASPQSSGSLTPSYSTFCCSTCEGCTPRLEPDRVWANPPYDGPSVRRFIETAAITSKEQGALWVLLLNASTTGTRWWHRYVWDKRLHRPREGVEVRFREGRIAFEDEDGVPQTSPRYDNVFIVFHPAEDRS